MTIIVQVSSTATTAVNNDILNWVAPSLPMAPLALVQNAIRDSVIELCERALIWRQELPQVSVLPPVSTVTTVAQVEGDQQVTVSDTTDFAVGDTITVALADTGDPGAGTRWRGLVATLPGSGVITLDGPLPDAVEIGATVMKMVSLYPLTLPTGTAFAKGLSAWLNDSPIDPISPDDLDTEFNNTAFGWVGVNWRTDVNLPTRWYVANDNTVCLELAPNAAGNLRILAALKPTRLSTTFPDWMFERYVETIAHGAKARVMMIPKMPYSNAQLGAWHMDQFYGLVGEARIRTARGTTRAPLRTHTVFNLR